MNDINKCDRLAIDAARGRDLLGTASEKKAASIRNSKLLNLFSKESETPLG